MTKEGKAFSKTEVFKLHDFIISLDVMAEEMLQNRFQIGYKDFLLMMHVDRSGAGAQDNIVKHSGYSKSAISKKVAYLVHKDLIQRVQNPDNRRENIIELTPKGFEILKSAYQLLTEASEPFFQALTNRDSFIGQVDTLYERMRKNNDLCD